MAATDPRRAAVRLQQLLAGVVSALLCAVMVFLGLWQMQVFESQRANTATSRAQQPPVPLEENLAQVRSGELYGRQVSVHGRFLPDQLLVGTEQPLRVVTAFRTDGGQVVAVVRGATSGTPPRPSAAPTTIQGVVLPTQGDPQAPVPQGAPSGTLSSLRLEQLVQTWPQPMLDVFITQTAEQQAAQGLTVAPAPLPNTDGGRARNRGYALQWWAFAAFGAVVGWVWVRAIGRKLDQE